MAGSFVPRGSAPPGHFPQACPVFRLLWGVKPVSRAGPLRGVQGTSGQDDCCGIMFGLCSLPDHRGLSHCHLSSSLGYTETSVSD
uniref:Uncharacterized protein n=1 Tax=Knipowitschia caucasica TaxID=637954 RepID=A0AAV2KSR6_KNICA